MEERFGHFIVIGKNVGIIWTVNSSPDIYSLSNATLSVEDHYNSSSRLMRAHSLTHPLSKRPPAASLLHHWCDRNDINASLLSSSLFMLINELSEWAAFPETFLTSVSQQDQRFIKDWSSLFSVSSITDATKTWKLISVSVKCVSCCETLSSDYFSFQLWSSVHVSVMEENTICALKWTESVSSIIQ